MTPCSLKKEGQRFLFILCWSSCTCVNGDFLTCRLASNICGLRLRTLGSRIGLSCNKCYNTYVYNWFEKNSFVRKFIANGLYIDASHATRHGMRGQTGGCILMGNGVLHRRSNKQKLNTKSSIETDLVGNIDYLPFAPWMLYFYEQQGYKIHVMKLHQDN